MAQPVVLIVFYSRSGKTEKLALAAAVGAVQARALIRLRRVPDANTTKTLEQFPDCKETLLRMHREYVAPTETDVLGADALILAAPDGLTTSSPEWSGYVDLLSRLAASGKLKLKVATVVDSDSVTTHTSFSDVITQMGLSSSPRTSGNTDVLERATALGRRTAQEAAR